MFVRTMTTDERFWSKVDQAGACWTWTAYASSDGYGFFRLTSTPRPGRVIPAHHYLVGAPAAGYEYDHLCRNRLCVRPDHLEMVTHKVNVQRIPAYSRGNSEKTQCKYGHPFSPENTRICANGARACITCISRYNREAYYKIMIKK